MSVNIFKCPVRTDRHPRTSSGAPAHSTTGAESASCSQRAGSLSSHAGAPGSIPPIASASTGSASAAPIQKRRVMSRSSVSSSPASATFFGSSAIPHFGHAPG